MEEEFDENRGIDIFIDQLRFVPTNCTIIKILVRMVDKSFVDLVKASACIPDFESPLPLPTYNFKWELRSDINYAKTAFLFFIMITLDVHSEDGKPNILGYSFFPLFLDKSTGQPATDASDDVVLHDGQYQLPVLCQDYPYAFDFDIKRALELEKVPCCSILIRVKKPPLDADGKPMSLESVDRSLWAKDVWPPFKNYRENFYYCTKYISNTKSEEVVQFNHKELYAIRFKDLVSPQKVIEITKPLLKAFSEPITIPANYDISDIRDELEDFVDKVAALDTAFLLRQEPDDAQSAVHLQLQPEAGLLLCDRRLLPATKARFLPDHRVDQPAGSVGTTDLGSTTSRPRSS